MKLKLYISLALLILTCHADNDRMPRIGLGTAGLGHDTASAVQFALDAGYRMFDTAQADEWYNEEMVGQTLKQWTGDSQSLFIVSKIHPRDFGYQRTRQLVQRSVERLGKVDLMLIHFPRCWEGLCEGYPYQDWNERDMVPEWLETWRALEDLQKRKVVRYIGVSNFELEELEKLVKLALVQPFAIQNWMDPLHQDRQARNFCRERGIEYMAYSLLGTQHQFRAGTYSQENPVLENPIIRRIASNHNLESTIPVILTWALSNQVVIIPRSRNSEHIASNWNLPQEIHLSKEEIEEINNL